MHPNNINFSFTILKWTKRSPLHAVLLKQIEFKSSAEQFYNLAIECAIQEPEKYKNEYVVHKPKEGVKKPKATNAWKADGDKYGYDRLVTEEEARKIEIMRENFFTNKELEFLYSKGEPQLRLEWYISDIKCKGFADWKSDALPSILDIKIVPDACDDQVNLIIAKQLYHVQAAMYRDGAAKNKINIEHSIIAFVESSYPFMTNAKILSDNDLSIGHEIYMESLYKWKKCRDESNFPAYGPGITEAKLPGWHTRKHFENYYIDD